MSDIDARRTLKTFGGVFCPVTLSQFSSVIFLRLGFLVGQSGFLVNFIQILLAYGLLLLTIFSVCAISTNGAVSGGGVYFMLSRTLGPEMGGSIGVLFYIAQVFSAALYIAAFTESVNTNFGPGGVLINGALFGGNRWWTYLYSTVVNFACFLVLLVGSGFFAKVSLAILVAVIIVICTVFASFFQHPFLVPIPHSNPIIYPNDTINGTVYFQFTGFRDDTFYSNLLPDYSTDYASGLKMDFLSVFAILVSGVTGIMNGANMSGELKNPAKSIPTGTLSAITFTCIIYLFLSLFSAATLEHKILINNYIYMQAISFWAPLVVIGVFCTTLSASLGNLIGGSRVLEALANDDIFGRFLNPLKWTTKGGNPLISVIVTHSLVQIVLLIGSLNAIAPAVSVLFLLAYSLVNFACMLLDIASAANFRPLFRYFHWSTSLIGGLACFIMAFLVQPFYAIAAIAILVIIALVLGKRDLHKDWGRVSQALLFHQVRKYLLLLDDRKSHTKFWRPQVVLLVSNPRSAASLVQFINSLKKGGLFVLGHVIVDKQEESIYIPDKTDPCEKAKNLWHLYVEHLKVKAFIELTSCRPSEIKNDSSVKDTMLHLVRLSGLGAMKPNTVCIGFFDNESHKDTLSKIKRIRKSRGKWTSDDEKRAQIFDHNCSTSNQSLNDIQTSDLEAVLTRTENSLSDLENQYTSDLGSKAFQIKSEAEHFLSESQYLDFIDQILNMQLNENAHLTNNPLFESSETGEIFNLRCSVKNGNIQMATRASDFDQLRTDFKKGGWTCCYPIRSNSFQPIQETSTSSMKSSCKSRRISFIDLWPIHPLKFIQNPEYDSSKLDLSGRFMLQLACLIGRAKQIRRDFNPHHIRMMIPVRMPNQGIKAFILETKGILAKQLASMRINAEIHLVPFPAITEVGRVTAKQLNQFNAVVSGKCTNLTAVCMLNLFTRSDAEKLLQVADLDYLQSLSILSKGLPPTLFVHGLHEVITVQL